MEKKGFGISGNILKLIAVVTMLIDHSGAVIVQGFLRTPGFNHELWSAIYTPLRIIGRVAFPIFCFLLVEGFIHTRDKGKYFFRMVMFAVISEIPFDLAVYGSFFYGGHQNVFWELALGILMMLVIHVLEERISIGAIRNILIFLTLIPAMVIGEALGFDYGDFGILSIFLLYIFRFHKRLQLLAGALSFLWEWPAVFGFLPVTLYNGKRGRQIKYAFYIIYPAHLLFFYFIVRVTGCSF